MLFMDWLVVALHGWFVVAVGVSCFVYFRGMPGQECVLVKHTDGNITSGV